MNMHMWSVGSKLLYGAAVTNLHHHQHTTTVLQPFFRGPPGWAGARRELYGARED